MNMFRTPKHQKFIYHPRYYDPEKEELMERIRSARGDQDSDIDNMKARIGKNYQSRYQRRKESARKTIRNTNVRVFVIFLVLLIFTYFLLVEFMPVIEAYLSE
jgi:hypothetical protein